MLRRADAIAPQRTRRSGEAGLVARMRDWFVASFLRGRLAAIAVRQPADVVAIAALRPAFGSGHGNHSLATGHRPFMPAEANHGAVVRLPLDERRRLVQLVRELRSAFEHQDPDHEDPLLCTLSAGARPRLQIDSTCHVDVRNDQPGYRVVLGEVHSTRIILETTEFDEASQFICQYLHLTRGVANVAGGAR